MGVSRELLASRYLAAGGLPDDNIACAYRGFLPDQVALPREIDYRTSVRSAPSGPHVTSLRATAASTMDYRSMTVIGPAICADLALAVTKLLAAAATRSAAMLAEAVHSTVDAGNGALLLVGLRLSRRPPDEAHPFGYGLGLYFCLLSRIRG